MKTWSWLANSIGPGQNLLFCLLEWKWLAFYHWYSFFLVLCGGGGSFVLTLLRSYGDFPAFTGGGRHCVLVQEQVGTWADPLTFHKIVPYVRQSKVSGRIWTHSRQGQVILSQQFQELDYGCSTPPKYTARPVQSAHLCSLTRFYTLGWPELQILIVDNGQFQKW